MAHHMRSLHDLFLHEMRDLYDAEKQITRALPKMASAAHSSDLRDAFNQHLEQTRNHIHRLDQVFNALGETHGDVTCKAMQGIIKEGEEIINEQGADPTVRDAALIAAAQRVEHYEIAGYGAVRTYADELGYDDAKDLLQDTLDEEGKTDKKLTKLATGGMLSKGINVKAKEH